MTISENAAQMGVTPETLVQEVVTQETTKETVLVVLGALAIVLAVVVGAICNGVDASVFGLYTACGLLWIGVILLTNVSDLIAWKTAPQTTVNRYIVEHYGGGQE
jgi:hypothetical protein